MQLARIVATLLCCCAAALPAFGQDAEDLYRDGRRALQSPAIQRERGRVPAAAQPTPRFGARRGVVLLGGVRARARRRARCGRRRGDAQRGGQCSDQHASRPRNPGRNASAADQEPVARDQKAGAVRARGQGGQRQCRADQRGVARNGLHTTNDLELRGQAVFWLSEIPGDATLDALAELLRSPEPAELAAAAVLAVAQIDDPRGAALLLDLAADETANLELREQAVVWIGEEGGEEAPPYLMDLHSSVTNADLRQQILFAAAQTGSPRALE